VVPQSPCSPVTSTSNLHQNNDTPTSSYKYTTQHCKQWQTVSRNYGIDPFWSKANNPHQWHTFYILQTNHHIKTPHSKSQYCYNYTIHIKRTSTDVITVRAHKAHKLKSSNYIFINCKNHTHCSFFIKHTSHINSLSHACYKTKSTGLVISTMKGLYKT